MLVLQDKDGCLTYDDLPELRELAAQEIRDAVAEPEIAADASTMVNFNHMPRRRE